MLIRKLTVLSTTPSSLHEFQKLSNNIENLKNEAFLYLIIILTAINLCQHCVCVGQCRFKISALMVDEIYPSHCSVGWCPGVSVLKFYKKCYLLKILCCRHMPLFIYHHQIRVKLDIFWTRQIHYFKEHYQAFIIIVFKS